MLRQTIIERAFELARTGPSMKLDDIRAQLKREGFQSVEAHLGGAAISKQLRSICSAREATLKEQ